jgi:hypothetical protein
MRKSRYDALVASLTSIAHKVFLAVPAQERWPVKAIYAELRRTNATSADVRVIEGCVDSLVDTGLVREGPTGFFSRVVPKEHENVVEDTSIEPVVEDTTTPVSNIYEFPVTPPPAEPVTEVADQPYTEVPIHEPPKRDHEYESYLNYRFERIMKALTVLAEHADDELGLGLLDIVDDMDDLQDKTLEYKFEFDCPMETALVLNPGWYHHEVAGEEYVTKDPIPPTVEQAMERRRTWEATVSEFHTAFPEIGERNRAEEAERINELFQKYEPDGGPERPYYDSLLDKLKNRIPELSTDTSDERMSEVRRKSRRGMCDVKIEGVSQSHEYRAWQNLVTPQAMQLLQEQGLDVESEWKDSFKAFLKDVGYKPHHNARLVRLDKTKGWDKNNVSWRHNGHYVPGRLRRPRNWPYNYESAGVVRNLERSVKDVSDHLFKK